MYMPLAGEQSKVYLEGTLSRRWSPIGHQPLVADGARSKRAENRYGAVHVGTGAEVAPCVIDWQDRDATIRWYELLLAECPHGQILLWQDASLGNQRGRAWRTRWTGGRCARSCARARTSRGDRLRRRRT